MLFHAFSSPLLASPLLFHHRKNCACMSQDYTHLSQNRKRLSQTCTCSSHNCTRSSQSCTRSSQNCTHLLQHCMRSAQNCTHPETNNFFPECAVLAQLLAPLLCNGLHAHTHRHEAQREAYSTHSHTIKRVPPLQWPARTHTDMKHKGRLNVHTHTIKRVPPLQWPARTHRSTQYVHNRHTKVLSHIIANIKKQRRYTTLLKGFLKW